MFTPNLTQLLNQVEVREKYREPDDVTEGPPYRPLIYYSHADFYDLFSVFSPLLHTRFHFPFFLTCINSLINSFIVFILSFFFSSSLTSPLCLSFLHAVPLPFYLCFALSCSPSFSLFPPSYLTTTTCRDY